MKKLLAAVAIAASAIAGPAMATVMTTTTQTITLGNLTPTNYSASGNFNLFDSSLGTLLSVSVYDSYGIATTLTVTNNPNASSPSSGYAYTDSTLTLSATDTNQSAVIKRLLGVADASSDKIYYDSLDPGASYTDSATSPTAYTTKTGADANHFVTDSTAADLAYFISSAGNTVGTVTGKTATNTVVSSDNGNTSATQQTNASGAFKIYYTYDNSTAAAVPEPATWAMMIAGFGLVGFGMRRKGTAVLFG